MDIKQKRKMLTNVETSMQPYKEIPRDRNTDNWTDTWLVTVRQTDKKT